MRAASRALVALALAAGPSPLSASGAGPSWVHLLPFVDQAPVAHDHVVSVSSDSRTLTFKLEDDATLELGLAGGRALIDGRTVGRYAPGGALERSWQDLLAELARVPTPLAVLRARAWAPAGLTGDELAAAGEFRARLAKVQAAAGAAVAPRAIPAAAAGGVTVDLGSFDDLATLEPALWRASQLTGDDLKLTIPGGRGYLGHYSLGTGETLDGHLLVLHGDADIFGTLHGNVATVDGDVVVHAGAVVTGSVLAVGGRVRDAGGAIRGEVLTLSDPETAPTSAAAPARSAWQVALWRGAGLIGVFLALFLVGGGLVAFSHPQVEVVADTVRHSFGRAFLAGLLGQILLVPTFGMIVVGLALTVVGLLLVPFAVAVYLLLAAVTIVGGYVAVAHAMGEVRARRRLAGGATGVRQSGFAYLAWGLTAGLALWGVWVAFGQVPVAGTLVEGAAVLVTWILATVGFGAALLSRLGLKDSFTGRFIPPEALTDEYLWATPQFGVPAVQRPGKSTVPPSRTPPPMP